MNKHERLFLSILNTSLHRSTALTKYEINDEDIEPILLTANKQNIFPLVYDELSKLISDNQKEYLKKFQMLAIQSIVNQSQKTMAFFSIYTKFIEADLHPIVMKGIICRQLYGKHANHRPSCDEDILIALEDFNRISNILINNGYICEFDQVSEKQLTTMQEITFSNPKTTLSIEVHLNNPMGDENDMRQKMNIYFKDCISHSIDINISNNNSTIPIRTMSYTDHFIFLIFHAFKHLTVTGMGIRQVMDILLFQETYCSLIDMAYVKNALTKTRTINFYNDLVFIGNKYLGFNLQNFGDNHASDELLEDFLITGVFGNETKESHDSGTIVEAAIKSGGNKTFSQKLKNTFYVIFPRKEDMYVKDPETINSEKHMFAKKINRIIRIVINSFKSKDPFHKKSRTIAKRRMELLDKYDVFDNKNNNQQ